MRRLNIILIVGVLCSAGVLRAAEDGFEPLFGSDGLKDWKVSDWSDVGRPQRVQGTPWKLEDGVLHGLNKRTWIMSPDEYGDVLAIHGATMKPDKPHPAGWMRSLPSERRCNPVGQWNHYRVDSRDGAISLAVNGEVVTKAYEASPRKGYICLESEGGPVHFRNIRIKELPGSNPPPEMIANEAEGLRPLYNGLDLRGWKDVPGHKGHWKATNWILDCDGKTVIDEAKLPGIPKKGPIALQHHGDPIQFANIYIKEL
jgi:hypothetical protein